MTDTKSRLARFQELGAKASKGPWALGNVDDDGDDGAMRDINGEGHEGLASVVWRMEGERSSPQQEATANLIASLPDLLALAVEMQGRIDVLRAALKEAMEWNWIDEDVPPDVVAQCNAALGEPTT